MASTGMAKLKGSFCVTLCRNRSHAMRNKIHFSLLRLNPEEEEEPITSMKFEPRRFWCYTNIEITVFSEDLIAPSIGIAEVLRVD
ncbi:unnamed protein product [Arabidopsis halleri]